MPCWRDLKESLVLTEVTAEDATDKGETECAVCAIEWQEITEGGGKIVRMAHCDCSIFYCESYVLQQWRAGADLEAGDGIGDWSPCSICWKRGMPEDQYFVRHFDYLGASAAKEIETDYFGAHVDAPRFKWEGLMISAVEIRPGVPEGLPHYFVSMMNVSESNVGYWVKVCALKKMLNDAAVKAEDGVPKATIERDAHALVCLALRDYRMSTIKDQKRWGEELHNGLRYAGDRIQLRRQESKKNKEPATEKMRGKTRDGDRATSEHTENVVEKILGHEVRNGVILLRVKWLGYAPSHAEAKSWEPYSNLGDKTSSHCLELIIHYFLHVEKEKPNDPVFAVPDFELQRPIEEDEEEQWET
ncbi:hypothetical protein LTR85_009051 [Meristemomyces frigidus]|nr:hypothetical protein LTR85_009051 [Meristemomyces frigidus]